MTEPRPRRHLVEVIPNLSEGRRLEVVQKIASALASVDGVVLLDLSCDPDHHRSVITAVGEPGSLEQGCLELYRAAVAEIDLTRHRGEHPRIGAVDVLPFVPLEGATMEDCIDLARRVGERVAEELRIPVFLYGRAAPRPARENLAEVRRQGLERLGRGDWVPDFGPAAPHPTAGATAIGVRGPLIAFNVVLDSERRQVAQEIARTVRESSGGLPAVKALAIELGGRRLVQVSMNLLDYRTTSVAAAYAAVVAAAHERGVQVLESEIVGLAPRAALENLDWRQIKLAKRPSSPVLEERIGEALVACKTQDETV